MTSDVFRFAAAVATVRAGIDSKKALLRALSRRLSFPDYFGFNFDALYECLGDLSWLPAGSVFIVHEALPRLDRATLDTYLSVLASAVRKWRGSAERELIVVFPPADAEAVAASLSAQT
ncbi:MAG TPA: barstar family protein [Kofleriaceae bacterium]|jgi:RNAse (barnase) inhibitor barstar